MLRKYFFFSIAAVAVLLFGTIAASAQTGEMRGHVVTKQNGTNAPVPDAAIDVYRLDIPGKYSTKADRKGHFVFAGLPYVGKYVIAVSAANMSPNIFPNAQAGREQD